MTSEIRKELEQDAVSKFHQDLLNRCLGLMKSSRSRMAERYGSWDRQQEVYNSRRPEDKQDQQLREQGVPSKFIVPLTFAQVQTWVAFCFLLFNQNRRFFELSPTGAEDHELLDINEQLIESDLRANRWPLLLYQFLTDIGKFGLGAIKTSWETETVDVPVTQTVLMKGVEVPQTTTTSATLFEGTRLYTTSPFRFFPDHRLPIRDFQRGEYCASTQEYTSLEMESLLADGKIVDFKKVGRLDFSNEAFNMHKVRVTAINSKEPAQDEYLITEIQLKLIPSQWELSNGQKLGPEKKPQIWIVWIANDSRVIKFERLGSYHGEFTFIAHELLPDVHEKLNLGWAELIDVLQEVAGWFINTRIQAVTQTIDNWLVVDPMGVEMSSVTSRQRVIVLKKAAARMGVERFIKQLQVQDTTTNHLKDSEMISQLIQVVTGINENAMGQYNSGRRSATEARAVISGASARMRMLAGLVYESLMSLGKQVMKNSRQALTPKCFAYKVGESRAAMWPQYHQEPPQIVQSQDYFIFDGTLPSEKSFLAQSLQELLAIVLQNPQAALAFNLDPNKLMKEIYELRGVANLGRFGLDQGQQEAIAGTLQTATGGVPAQSAGEALPAGTAGGA